MTAPTALTDETTTRRRVLSDRITHVVLAAVAYLPLLRTRPGIIGADTKQYLYLDPNQLMNRAASIWDPSIGLGTVSHQNVGYLWPMGPWYRFFEAVGASDWLAQRLWLATLFFAAGAGVMFLLRQLGMRGLGASVAALSYMLSPYVLAYASRISAILLPWAGLPWLIGLFIISLRRGGWRWPAAFALVVTTVGSINASSLLFAMLAVLLWVPFAVWHLCEIDLRQAWRTLLRVGVLTAVTQVWWMVALVLSSAYGPPVLETTESFEAVSTSSASTEVARSLGNWFFYGRDSLGAWVEASVPYTQEGWLMAISFVLPIVAFGAAAIVRWQHRAYFTTLIVAGALIAVAAFPFDDPSPFGALAKSITDSSTLAMALRNAQRAVPLLALGVAAMLGSFVNAVGDRVPWGRVLSAAPLTLLIFANFPALWNSTLVDENLQRPEKLPEYLLDAAAHLDQTNDGTRVLEIPGTDFGAYRFGVTVDPVMPGLIDRPWVGHENAPQGTEGSIDLIGALDGRLQEGTFEPESLAPLARLMRAGDIVLRGDLQTERYRTPRPAVLADWFQPPPAGLRAPQTFGDGVPNERPVELPMLDEIELATPQDGSSLPAISVFPVTEVPPIVSTTLGEDQIVLSGDGDGVVDAAAAGLLDGNELLVYSGDLAGMSSDLDGIVFNADAHLVITDTNRRQAQQFISLRENTGATETADEIPLKPDLGDARLDLFGEKPGDGDPTRTVTVLEGVQSIRATGYGNTITYLPEQRPSAAFDNDAATAWKTRADESAIGERLRIDFTERLEMERITLLQPVTGDRNRWITTARLRFSDGTTQDVELDDSSRSESGQTVDFPMVSTDSLEIEILADSADERSDYGGLSAVGFAEVNIPGVDVTESVRLPTDVVRRAGGHSGPLSVVLTRLRANPANLGRNDPETHLVRTFTLPQTPTGFDNYEVSGSMRLAADAPDEVVDRLLGRPDAQHGGVTASSSSRLPGDLASGASSALDGDPTTAWVPALGEQVGQHVRYEFGRSVSTDSLDLQVLADGRHSLPTSLRLENESGDVLDVAVPPLTVLTAPSATQATSIDLPDPFTAQTLTVTVTGIDAETTPDYFSRAEVTLPVGIVDIGLSGGETVKPMAEQIDGACRTGLLNIDGEDIPVSITGASSDAQGRESLDFVACTPSIRLDEGAHDVLAADAATAGLDVDRVVIDRIMAEQTETPAAGPGGGAEAASAPTIRADRTSRSSHHLVIRGADEPFFVVFGESFNPAWKASVDNGNVSGAPIRVDGYANAWYVDPATADPEGRGIIDMTLRWGPQQWAMRAQQFSLFGAIACVFLLFTGRRTRRRDDLRPLPTALARVPVLNPVWDRPDRALQLVPTVVVSLVLGVAGALVVDLVYGPILACIAIVLGLRPRLRALLPLGAAAAVACAGLLTVGVQMWKQYPPGFNWVSNFELLHPLGLVAFSLLALDTALEVVAARSAPPREVREPPSTLGSVIRR